MMDVVKFVSSDSIERVAEGMTEPYECAAVQADLLRMNVLSMIQCAGSGHIGTSFSCMDLLWWVYSRVARRPNQENGDVVFSSKGHDVPAFYAVQVATGLLPEDSLSKLRQLGGLPGHPDVSVPGVVTNTGSLGMGISKARGFAQSWRLQGRVEERQVFVILGDGELQEGQIWESLQPTANGGFHEITVIVDHNKFQSDWPVEQVSSLGDLETKFRAFDWVVGRCDGHDFRALDSTLASLREEGRRRARPQILIADTIKGRGVSFMEGSRFSGGQLYKYHSGAPDYETYLRAYSELLDRVTAAQSPKLDLEFWECTVPVRPTLSAPERLVPAYGNELLLLGEHHPNLVVLDGDLMLDCGLVPFQQQFPLRFIECGIAEQDMVSMAGALALSGILPVVHSFSCFLSTRPNEQIYNNASERSKVVYVGSLAGLLPAAPGHSHQSVRDISAVGGIPGLVVLEPANEKEARMAIRWAVEENKSSTYIRLVTVPVETRFALPPDYKLRQGFGCRLTSGRGKLAVIGYGPWVLSESIKAAELLSERGLAVDVFNFPWLNCVESDWLHSVSQDYQGFVVVDNQYENAGLGVRIASQTRHPVLCLGVKGWPVSGQPGETLEHHGLSGGRLAVAISDFWSCLQSEVLQVGH